MRNSHQLYSFPVVIFSLLIFTVTGAKQNLSQKLETVHRLHTYYRNSLLLCKVPSQPPAYDMEVLVRFIKIILIWYIMKNYYLLI